MQLVKLSVYKNQGLLREIHFKRGLNLIVNSEHGHSKSGNSVGKSTPSRLLDYIFMSSGEDIYKEKEFDKLIPDVSNFIDENNIYIELTFNGFDKKIYNIGRFLTRESKKSGFYIDSKAVDKKEYIELISLQMFGLVSDKPSLRSVSHKFIRNTNEKMQNTTRFLHATTKPDIYDQVYLFLFGFRELELLKTKSVLNNQISTKRKHLAAYRNPHKESALERMIKPLEAEATELQTRISNFDFRDNQERGVKELVKVQNEISELTVSYSKVESRIGYLVRSIEKLRSNATRVENKELYEIYLDAGVAVSSDLKRSYEELVIFHNKILSNKVKLIEKELEKYKASSNHLRKEINILQEAESGVFKNISEPDTLKSIGLMYNELSSIREKIASTKALLDKIEDTKAFIENLENEKERLVEQVNLSAKSLDENVEIFNLYFSEFSKKFYDESYIFDLTFDIEKEKCDFDIASISPNSTGGKKKGELSAFDFAYMRFINEKKLKRPTFVVHDSIEDVDVKQIFDIFQSARNLEGQYIVSVLSDKISGASFDRLKAENVILELSEDDKFFKLK